MNVEFSVAQGCCIVALLSACAVQGPTAAAQSSTLYVDNSIQRDSCRDYDASTATCGSGTLTAYADIQSAAGAVAPGTTVMIQPGSYSGGIVVTSGGNAQAPVTFKANGPGVIIQGSGDKRDAFYINQADHVHVDGLEIQQARRAGLRISRAHHVQLRNSVFRDNGSWGVFTDFSDHTLVENCEVSGSEVQHGVYISNSSDYPIIRGNLIHGNAAAGVHMNGDATMRGDGIISHALIENNIIYQNGRRGGSAVNLDGVTDSIIRNNLLYENQASGISLYQIDGGSPSHSNQIIHNTIVNGRSSRWAVNLPNTENNHLFNNIILNRNRFRGGILVREPIGEGFQSDYNVLMNSMAMDGVRTRRLNLEAWQAEGYDQHSIVAEISDLFVNWSSGDYRLKEGSAAIDLGTATGEATQDLEGNSRPFSSSSDAGAYEWQP